MEAHTFDMPSSKLLKSILFTALVAGILDLAGAVVSYMISRGGGFPKKILEYIAGGWYGSAALDGSLKMNIVGGISHFFIATCWTALFYFLYPRLRFLQKSRLVSAILYGLVIWAVMNLAVLPLSAWNAPLRLMPFEAAKAAFILIVCVGLPVVVRTGSYYKSIQTGA
ncbi:MAG TPA: hypothetical protein PKM27_14825 [Saprospiraceae bacterium]|nr:hypothetical protein [Saprospiraceae bacterium]HNT21633.1 hypothetical protein [Saprospiraceae bacterium]